MLLLLCVTRTTSYIRMRVSEGNQWDEGCVGWGGMIRLCEICEACGVYVVYVEDLWDV